MRVYESFTDIKAAVLTEGFTSEVKNTWSKVLVGCWVAIVDHVPDNRSITRLPT